MKTITSQRIMKVLSIIFIILSVYNLVIDLIVCLYITRFQVMAMVINDIIFLVFGIFGIRNYDIPGKERTLIKMSVISFLSSVISTLVYYLPLLTRLNTETFLKMIDFDDLLYISPAVLCAVYYFAARRNLANKDYH